MREWFSNPAGIKNWLSDRGERWLVRLFQVGLLAVAGYGLSIGRTSVVVNGLVGFAVTLVPALLRRDRNVSLDTGYVVWISVAVFLHAVGFFGLYATVPWYDAVTHTLSAAVVAGVAYAVMKAIERNSDRTTLSPEMEFAFLVVFVLAFGVFWEILEFVTGLVGRRLFGTAVLVQYGLDDTIHDLVFDLLGGLVVAGWDAARPKDAADEAAEAMDD